jgi:hypothetical protein
MSDDFEPMYGYPPLVRVSEDAVEGSVLETRGFGAKKSNVVPIGEIMNVKKKENLFLAFGDESEDSETSKYESLLDIRPDIQYEDLDTEVFATEEQKFKPQR